MEEDVQVTEK